MTTKVKGSVFDLINYGSGSPEGVFFGDPGHIYINTDGGAGTTLYIKESGLVSVTGWVGK